MDLESLRAKALSTKRKPAAGHATLQDSQSTEGLEEGEIVLTPTIGLVARQDGSRQPSQERTTAVTATDAAQNPSPMNLMTGYFTESTQEQTFSSIKEESKALVAELIQYGITAQYLLSRGCSPETINFSFKDLDLPELDVIDQAVSSDMDMDHDGEEDESVAEHPSQQPIQAGDELEKQKRDELLARKATTAARNHVTAMNLVQELEQLISVDLGPSTVVPPEEASSSNRGHSPMPAPAITYTHQPISQAPIEDQDTRLRETQEVPLQDLKARAETRPSRSRPRAIDFDGSPWEWRSSGGPVAQKNRALSYLPVMPTRLVIDLSDDESEDLGGVAGKEDGAVAPERITASGTSSQQTVPMSRVGGTISNSSTATKTARALSVPSGSDAGEPAPPETQLRAKEQEIRRIMARIAELEKKKLAHASMVSGKSL